MDVDDIPGFEAALKDMRPQMAESMMWIVPEDKKNFDPVTAVTVVVGFVLTSFLAGFQDEASKQAKALGGKAAIWLGEQLKTATGKVVHHLPTDIAEAARKGAERLRADKPDDAALAASQAAIAAVLTEHMPAEQAQSVAAQIRTTVLKTMAAHAP